MALHAKDIVGTQIDAQEHQGIGLAIADLIKDVSKVIFALIGASKVSQIEDNVGALNNLDFSQEELQSIEEIQE